MQEPMKDLTHIQVSVETRDQLRDMKRGQENYDHLLKRILEHLDEDWDRPRGLGSMTPV